MQHFKGYSYRRASEKTRGAVALLAQLRIEGNRAGERIVRGAGCRCIALSA